MAMGAIVMDRLKHREIAFVGDETMRNEKVSPISVHRHYWCIPGLTIRKGANYEEIIRVVEDKFRQKASRIRNYALRDEILKGQPYLHTVDRSRLFTDLRGILCFHFYNSGKNAMTYDMVGKIFSKDHSTVIHYEKRHNALYGHDKAYTSLADEVYSLIGFPKA